MRGLGRVIFVAAFLVIGGALNIIYGIAAISNSRFFAQNTHYVFADLKTWGWVALILGVLQLLAALSLAGGGAFGRFFGMAAGMLTAIGALLDLPAYPLYSIGIFALSLWVVYGLAVYGDSEAAIEA